MAARIVIVGVCIALISGCGEDAAGSGAVQSDVAGTDSGTDGATDGTADGAGDGTTDGAEDGEIPDCNFAPPVGAQCNPYPGCPGTGCGEGRICTLVVDGDIKRIQCADPGDVPPGGACDDAAGQRCGDGLCVDGQCRGFCVGLEHCPENATCEQLPGVPGKPTVCGAVQADCDPLDAAGSCGAGLACYLQTTGLTDCMVTQGGGTQGSACDGPNTCSPGFTCTTVEGTQLCGQTCALVDGQACDSCPAETVTKPLTDTYGACVPQGEEPPPPPDPIPCDINAQDCAGAAQACYPTNQGDQCLARGNSPVDADCGSVNDCATGLFCHASGRCKILCDPANAMNPTCETGIQAQCSPIGGSAAGFCDE